MCYGVSVQGISLRTLEARLDPGEENVMTTNATRFADSIAQEAQEYLSGVSRIGIPGTWRDLTSTYHLYSPRAHAHGLETAINRLSEEVKVHVGYGISVPYNYGPRPEWRREDAPEKVVSAKAEVNWILGASQLATQWPVAAFMLHHFFRDGINGGNGCGSPYSCLASIPFGVHSPGTLVRRMIKILAKARVLMSTSISIDGMKPSWAAIAVAAAGKLPVNKAAMTVWAMTLRCPRLEGSIVSELRHYRAARNWLSRNLCSAPSRCENFAAWTRDEEQEGSRIEVVEGVRAIARLEKKVRHGITVQECTEIQTSQDGNPAGRGTSIIVRIGGFAYHHTSWWGLYDNPKHREAGAIKRAIEALRRHREALRIEGVSEEIQRMLSGGRLEILVTRDDSYAAGNCWQGTEAFVRQHGYSERLYAPATALLSSGNSRAVAAARVAIRQFAEAMAA